MMRSRRGCRTVAVDEKREERRQFTLKEKLLILKKIDNGKKKSEVAKEYDIAPSTLSTILRDRKKIEDKIKEGALGPERKKIRSALYDDIDKATFLWLQDVRSRNIPISGPIIRKKALEFGKLLKIDTFQASVGWLNRFRERYGIAFRAICGEESSVSLELVNEWRAGEIKTIMEEYSINDIFNADETGIFYQLLPHCTLTVKGDPCRGGEKSKLRLTALFCCNASGTEKLKPLIIGRYDNPRCLKNVRSLPCEYRANQRAWMTKEIFNEWLKNFDTQMKRQNRKVLLLIDNCSAHNLTCVPENVKVEFLPPNCTAVLQPLDLGITRAVKVHYRSQLIKKLLLNLVSEDSKKIDVKEACDMIVAAWSSVNESTICNCWKKSSILKNSDDEIQISAIDAADMEVEDEIREMWSSLVDATGVSYDDYIAADENLLTASELTDVDIIENVQPSTSTSNSMITLESEDEDEIMPPDENISFLEAMDGLKKIQGYLSCSTDVPENIFQQLCGIESFVINAAMKN